MPTTRRHLMQISGVGSGLLAAGLARPSLAMSNQVRIGWLPALTGASSSTGIAMTRGITFGVAEINAAGGVGGRQLELITRDTQSDPTKAVNAATELTRGRQGSTAPTPCFGGSRPAMMRRPSSPPQSRTQAMRPSRLQGTGTA